MSFYLPNPKVEIHHDDSVTLLDDYTLDVVADGKRLAVTVGKGFHCDGLSIPRVAWVFVGHPLKGDALPAGLIHDALYASEAIARVNADLWFRALLKINGVGVWRRNRMYYAVRNWGWAVWKKHTPESRAEAWQYLTLNVEAAQ